MRHVDDAIVVVDKPAGVLSAPTPESDRSNLQSWLIGKLGAPIHVVHRLDRLTSGLLVFARNPDAAARLNELLQQRSIEREYLLAVSGRVDFDVREVCEPVRGKAARTWLCCQQRGELASLLRARLGTGRTHQIRVHTAALGHPILGDPLHRTKIAGLVKPPRLALHAARLGFPHPVSSTHLEFDSPWPEELAAYLHELNTSRALRSGLPVGRDSES